MTPVEYYTTVALFVVLFVVASVFLQSFLVICSFADKKIKFNNPFKGKGGKLLLSNYETVKPELNDVIYLQPYEGRAYIVG